MRINQALQVCTLSVLVLTAEVVVRREEGVSLLSIFKAQGVDSHCTHGRGTCFRPWIAQISVVG